VVTRSGTSVDLAPNLEGLPAAAPTFTPSHMVGAGAGAVRRQLGSGLQLLLSCLCNGHASSHPCLHADRRQCGVLLGPCPPGACILVIWVILLRSQERIITRSSGAGGRQRQVQVRIGCSGVGPGSTMGSSVALAL